MNQQQAMGMLAGFLVCIAIAIAIGLLLQILFCLTLYRTQQQVAERNQVITPGLVWLDMIPLFNVFWPLYMVPKLSDSLRNEFRDRGWGTAGENFGRGVGLIYAWAGVINFAIGAVEVGVSAAGMNGIAQVLNLTSCPLGLTSLICWIIYWVQMAQYGRRLREDRGRYGYRPGSIEEDYDDEYRGRRRDAIEDDEDYDRRRRRRAPDYVDDNDRPRRAGDERDDDEGDRPRKRPERDEY
ncbi:MAG TPA: hypothetical protein VKD90_04000 [Gemmataceae bacterium]|nr:hypothetical protein [Gemmataceae bacterium]